MATFRKLVYLGMALMLLTAPLLACTLPGMNMSDEEQDCCRHMADQCGHMQMDASHTCCTRTPSSDAGTLQQTVKYSLAPLALAIGLPVSQAIPPEVSPAAGSFLHSALRSSESPPGFISVLRI